MTQLAVVPRGSSVRGELGKCKVGLWGNGPNGVHHCKKRGRSGHRSQRAESRWREERPGSPTRGRARTIRSGLAFGLSRVTLPRRDAKPLAPSHRTRACGAPVQPLPSPPALSPPPSPRFLIRSAAGAGRLMESEPRDALTARTTGTSRPSLYLGPPCGQEPNRSHCSPTHTRHLSISYSREPSRCPRQPTPGTCGPRDNAHSTDPPCLPSPSGLHSWCPGAAASHRQGQLAGSRGGTLRPQSPGEGTAGGDSHQRTPTREPLGGAHRHPEHPTERLRPLWDRHQGRPGRAHAA